MKIFAFCAILIALISLSGNYIASADDESNDMPSVTEEPIAEKHIVANGEREYLSPNLIGLQNIAITNLPISINFVNIIDAFREIVDGVRYEIILNATNRTESSENEIICRLVILEKPWLTTLWGDRVRLLQYSNCTAPDQNVAGNEIDSNSIELSKNYKKNTIFDGGARSELTDTELANLEAQIVLPKILLTSEKKAINDAVFTKESVESTTVLSTEITEEYAGQTFENADETVTETVEKIEVSQTESTSIANQEYSTDQESSQSSNNDQVFENLQQNEELISRSKRSTLGGPAVGAPNAVKKEDLHEYEGILDKSLTALAAGEGPTYKISKVYSATTQVVAGSLYKIQAELTLGDSSKVNCTASIWSRPWLPNGEELTLNCDNQEKKVIRHSRSIVDAEKKTHKKQLHNRLEKSEILFTKFQNKFNRQYQTSIERQMRYRIFQDNLKLIDELNRMEQGTAKYGLTEFADMTSAEYKQRTGLLPRTEGNELRNPLATIPDIELPREFDWRKKGVVSEVKNQGQCGSCWAFSVTGNIEGLHAIKTGKLEEYSEQELLDCDTVDSACNGGLPDNAYQAIEKIGGLELESDYPYEERKDTCKFQPSKASVRVKGAVDLPKNETAMAQWLVANGPISIGLNANAMQFYRGGVSHPWRLLCRHSSIDHGVLIVGFGVSEYPLFNKTLPYWIVKNSWGPKWGEQGYYRVYRGDNTCGINSMASSAVLVD